MCIVTWNVSGRDFEVDAFLKRFPVLEDSEVWHRGAQGPLRRVWEDSGFSLELFEDNNPAKAMPAVRQALAELEEVRAALVGLNVRSELRFGLYVGSRESFVPALCFDAEDMGLFARAGVAVVVLGYPTNGE